MQIALEDIISPLSQDHHIKQWQRELLIETLIVKNVSRLALRALRAPGPPITPTLEIRTLLVNDLITEAYQLQRTNGGQYLLREFFRGCHELCKWSYVLDLALTDYEGEYLGHFLRTNDAVLGENLHVLYLLQRSKYFEAISFIDKLQKKRRSQQRMDLETPNLILSAYNLTMTPITKHISNLYYNTSHNDSVNLLKNDMTNVNKHKQQSLKNITVPLSSKFLRNKLLSINDVYHRSISSTAETFAQPPPLTIRPQLISPTNKTSKRKQVTFSVNSIPFLRNPQYDLFIKNDDRSICYPKSLTHNTQKRRRENILSDSSESNSDDDGDNRTKRSANAVQRKKQKLFDENLEKSRKSHGINTSLLTRFRDRPTMQTLRTNVDNRTHTTQHINNDNITNVDTVDISLDTNLKTPIVQSILIKDALQNTLQNSDGICSTPQSILKVKHDTITEQSTSSIMSGHSLSPVVGSLSPVVGSRGHSVDTADDKSIRFKMPLTSSFEEQESDSNEESSQILENLYEPEPSEANNDNMIIQQSTSSISLIRNNVSPIKQKSQINSPEKLYLGPSVRPPLQHSSIHKDEFNASAGDKTIDTSDIFYSPDVSLEQCEDNRDDNRDDTFHTRFELYENKTIDSNDISSSTVSPLLIKSPLFSPSTFDRKEQLKGLHSISPERQFEEMESDTDKDENENIELKSSTPFNKVFTSRSTLVSTGDNNNLTTINKRKSLGRIVLESQLMKSLNEQKLMINQNQIDLTKHNENEHDQTSNIIMDSNYSDISSLLSTSSTIIPKRPEILDESDISSSLLEKLDDKCKRKNDDNSYYNDNVDEDEDDDDSNASDNVSMESFNQKYSRPALNLIDSPSDYLIKEYFENKKIDDSYQQQQPQQQQKSDQLKEPQQQQPSGQPIERTVTISLDDNPIPVNSSNEIILLNENQQTCFQPVLFADLPFNKDVNNSSGEDEGEDPRETLHPVFYNNSSSDNNDKFNDPYNVVNEDTHNDNKNDENEDTDDDFHYETHVSVLKNNHRII